jgi:hypothetical protein
MNSNAAAGRNLVSAPVARSLAATLASLPVGALRNPTISVFVWIVNFGFDRTMSRRRAEAPSSGMNSTSRIRSANWREEQPLLHPRVPPR